MGRRTIVIETRGDICMSDRDNPRSLVEIMNDVLSTVREHYDSEYVYYIEKEYEDIDVRRAREQKERAEEQLRQKQSIQQYYHTQASLARAMNRLRLSQDKKWNL